jgi:propanediol utilization protein
MVSGVPGTTEVTREAVEALVRRAVYRYLPDARLGRTGAAMAPVPAAPRLVVNISARHVHLDQESLEILFGKGAALTVQKELYQQGAYAAEQSVTVFGPRKQMIANVRILGPLRDHCQVELAFSDARFVGIDAPIRHSGDVAGTPGCYLVGPAGGLELKCGVIRAARHVHMSPAEAEHYGVRKGDLMRLVVDSDQGGVLDGVLCRASDKERLEVHVDTDEGNALDLVHARKVHLERQ